MDVASNYIGKKPVLTKLRRLVFHNKPLLLLFVIFLAFPVNIQDISEVRCGQQTRNFNLFPYVEVDKQSFSLIFERDRGKLWLFDLMRPQSCVYVFTTSLHVSFFYPSLSWLKIRFSYKTVDKGQRTFSSVWT